MDNQYFDRQLRTIQNVLAQDYAGLALSQEPMDFRFYTQSAGMAWKEGKLDQLLFVRYVSQMLATSGDRNLRIDIDPAFFVPNHLGFDVRRLGEELLVTHVHEDGRFHPGDRIVQMNRYSPGEHKNRFQKNFLYSDVAERELWNPVVGMCETVTVVHLDGTSESVPVVTYTGRRPANESYVIWLDQNTLQIHLGASDSNSAMDILESNRQVMDTVPHLILDLRNCCGSSPEPMIHLMPYILPRSMTLNDAVGQVSYRTLYSESNVKRRAEMLSSFASDPGVKTYVDELMTKAGKGWQTETFSLYDDLPDPIEPAGNQITIWTDSYTEGEPENFVSAAKQLGRARVIGRSTMGSIDFADMICVRISPTCVLTYPMSITEEAAQGHGYLGCGVEPDTVIPFTPMEIENDSVWLDVSISR